MSLILQEVSNDREIEIPGPVRDVYRFWASQQVDVNGMSISIERRPIGPVFIVTLQGIAPTIPMRKGESYPTVVVTLFGKSGVVGMYVLRGVTVSEAGGQMNLTFNGFEFARQEMSTAKPMRFGWDLKTNTAK